MTIKLLPLSIGFNLAALILLANQYQVGCLTTAKHRPVRVYVDVIGDLFHYGHAEFFKQAKEFGDQLIVGVCSDQESTPYKRTPILTHDERVRSIANCKYVDEVISNVPVKVTRELIDEHAIDLVVHGDDFDHNKLAHYYEVPIKMGIFKNSPLHQRNLNNRHYQ